MTDTIHKEGSDGRDPANCPGHWGQRAESVLPWLPHTGQIADVGCDPRQTFGAAHHQSVTYISAGLKTPGRQVQEIDLDKEAFPKGPFGAVVILDVLEYLERPGIALRKARQNSDLLVASYTHPKGLSYADLRKERGWVNAFAPAVFERLLGRQGWAVTETKLYSETDDSIHLLYRCEACEPVKPPKLGPVATQVRAERLTYLRPEKMARLELVLANMEHDNVPGAFAEFGLALGGSGIVMAHAAQQQGRVFHGFDVFSQIPAPTSDHDDDLSRARYATIATGESKGIGGDLYYGYRDDLLAEVSASFARFGLAVDGETVVLHEGLFEETWPQVSPTPIACAHVDCDWYDPVRYCLDAVATVLTPGGVILLDDYHDYGGAKKAVDNFLAVRTDFTFCDGPNVLLKKA